MKVETTITIEDDLLRQVDLAAKNFHSRSEVVAKALQDFLPRLKQTPKKKKLSRKKEIETLNRIGREQHDEILETLSYQAVL